MTTRSLHEATKLRLCKTRGCENEAETKAGLCSDCDGTTTRPRRKRRDQSAVALLPQARVLALAFAEYIEAKQALRLAYEDLRRAAAA